MFELNINFDYKIVTRYIKTDSCSGVESVQSSGKVCILDIDVQGVRNVKESTLDPYYVFIAPPSMDALEKRLRGRGWPRRRSPGLRPPRAPGLRVDECFSS